MYFFLIYFGSISYAEEPITTQSHKRLLVVANKGRVKHKKKKNDGSYQVHKAPKHAFHISNEDVLIIPYRGSVSVYTPWGFHKLSGRGQIKAKTLLKQSVEESKGKYYGALFNVLSRNIGEIQKGSRSLLERELMFTRPLNPVYIAGLIANQEEVVIDVIQPRQFAWECKKCGAQEIGIYFNDDLIWSATGVGEVLYNGPILASGLYDVKIVPPTTLKTYTSMKLRVIDTEKALDALGLVSKLKASLRESEAGYVGKVATEVAFWFQVGIASEGYFLLDHARKQQPKNRRIKELWKGYSDIMKPTKN